MRDPNYFKNNSDFKNEAAEASIKAKGNIVNPDAVVNSFVRERQEMEGVSRVAEYKANNEIKANKPYLEETRQGNTEKFDNLQQEVDKAESQESVHKTIKSWQGKQKKRVDAD